MTRRVLGLLCSLIVCAGGWLPALADEEATGAASGKDQAVPSKGESKSESKSESKATGEPLPRRLAAFAAGVVIGTPIAIARKCVQQTVNATHDIVGDSTNPLFVLPAGALSLPYAVLGGTLEGVYTGAINAWVNSDDDPFGKDSFSLGEME